jgi:hypothetical protein
VALATGAAVDSEVVAKSPEVAAARRAGEIEGYMINLPLYAAAYFIGVFFWLLIDARKPIVADEPAEPAPDPDRQTW